MEKQILNVLGFDLYSPTAVGFVKVYNHVIVTDIKSLTCAFYIADLMLLSAKSNIFEPSLMASACLFIGIVASRASLEVRSFQAY